MKLSMQLPLELLSVLNKPLVTITMYEVHQLSFIPAGNILLSADIFIGFMLTKVLYLTCSMYYKWTILSALKTVP